MAERSMFRLAHQSALGPAAPFAFLGSQFFNLGHHPGIPRGIARHDQNGLAEQRAVPSFRPCHR
jgi:hypothetical protein